VNKLYSFTKLYSLATQESLSDGYFYNGQFLLLLCLQVMFQ